MRRKCKFQQKFFEFLHYYVTLHSFYYLHFHEGIEMKRKKLKLLIREVYNGNKEEREYYFALIIEEGDVLI